MRQRLRLILIALIFCCSDSFAQSEITIDSLKAVMDLYAEQDTQSLKDHLSPYLIEVKEKKRMDLWVFLLTRLVDDQFGKLKDNEVESWIMEADSILDCCQNGLFRTNGDSTLVIKYLEAKANYFYDIKRYDQAVGLYRLIAKITPVRNYIDSVYAAVRNSHLGNVYLKLSNPDRALFYYQNYLRLLPESLEYYYGKDYALFYRLVGYTYLAGCWYSKGYDGLNQKYYLRATRLYHSALALIDRLKDPGDWSYTIISAYDGLISLHQDYGHYDSAMYYLKKAEKYKDGTVDISSRLLFLEGEQNFKEARYDDALRSFNKALTLQAESKRHNQTHNYYINNKIALLYAKRHEYDDALEWVQNNLYSLSNANYTSDFLQNPKPLDFFFLPEAINTLQVKASILAESALTSANAHHLSASINTYQLAVKLSLRQRRRSFGTEAKQQYVQQHRKLINDAIDVCYRGQHLLSPSVVYDWVFWLMENGKGLLIQEELQHTRVFEYLDIPSDLTKLYDSLALQRDILSDSLRKEGEIEPNQLSRIQQVELAFDSVGNIMQQSFPMYFELMQETLEVTLSQYQSKPSKDQNTLSYFQGSEAYYLLAFDKEQVIFEKVLHADQTAETITELLDMVRNKTNDERLMSTLLGALYKSLIDPVSSILDKGESIKILPDSYLNYLPFDLLLTHLPQDNDFRNWPFFINQYPISYEYSWQLENLSTSGLSSKSDIPYLGVAPNYGMTSPKDLMVLKMDSSMLLAERDFGRLIFNKEEVENVHGIFRGDVLLGAKASKSNFLALVQNANLLHLSMHAYVDESNHDQSGLVFSDFEEGKQIVSTKGFLSMSELSALKLKAELAILSACETGYGYLERGDGVMSLGRAFKLAGCPSITMSIWKANDYSTAKIITYYAENLANGMPKDKALQNAKLLYLNNADKNTAHPYFWGAFILHGNTKPLSQNSSNTIILVIILALSTIGFFMSLGYILWRRRT